MILTGASLTVRGMLQQLPDPLGADGLVLATSAQMLLHPCNWTCLPQPMFSRRSTMLASNLPPGSQAIPHSMFPVAVLHIVFLTAGWSGPLTTVQKNTTTCWKWFPSAFHAFATVLWSPRAFPASALNRCFESVPILSWGTSACPSESFSFSPDAGSRWTVSAEVSCVREKKSSMQTIFPVCA